MEPIHFPDANDTIGAAPVNRAQGMILTRWKATWRERLAILVHGTCWLAVIGDTMQPTLLTGYQQFYVKEPPITVG